MDAVIVAFAMWAATSDANPWAVAAAVIGPVATAATVYVSVAAFRAKKIADRGQAEIDGVKVSIQSLESSLARADVDRTNLKADLDVQRADNVAVRAELALARATIREMQTQIETLMREMRDERRMHADRVKVLVRQIRTMGGDVEGEDHGS